MKANLIAADCYSAPCPMGSFSMALWGQLGFQDAASPLISQLIEFHDHAIIILTLVTTLISYSIITIINNSFSSRYTLEAHQIELIWTILPAVILLFLALPSLRLLYIIDEVRDAHVTIKTIGHQWYWRYEYSDFNNLEFDSYIQPSEELTPGAPRLIEADNHIVTPINAEIRFMITAADVLHSWTIPRIGVKADAVPGRLNQVSIISTLPGTFYGQCSEICGANHSFIPITLEIVSWQTFRKWVSSFSSCKTS